MSFARNYALRGFFGGKGEPGGDPGVTIRNQNKTITENGTYKADAGYTGLGTVTVNVPEREPVLEPLTVTENGTYNPGSGVDGFSPVTVNVEASGGVDLAIGLLTGAVTEITDSLFPGLETLKVACFYNDVAITNVRSSTLKTIGSACFMGSSVVNFHAENLENMEGTNSFRSSGSLKTFVCGFVSSVVRSCFEECNKLEYADFKGSPTINSYAFWNNKVLTNLILRGSSVAPLADISAFDKTPFASGGTGGTVYVPEALIEDYKVATNWATLYEAGALTFATIEGSEYE